jgi:hypothetical protein
MRRLTISVLLLLLLGLGSLNAQETSCQAIVFDALAAVDSLCEETGRNEACYGNVMLTVEARDDVKSLNFDAPGDRVRVADIQSLRLTGMDEAVPEWGVALMKLQANLPDTLPGQNVTILLFGDVDLRNATDADDEAVTPMQAFYFRSGVGDSPCAEAPESGILIQTPEGVGEVEIVVNEVKIQLGSTAFLQAVPGEAMVIDVLEGLGVVEAFGERRFVPAGVRVRVPIDANLAASGPPALQEAYRMIDLRALPVDNLPDKIEVAPPLAENKLEKIRGFDRGEGIFVVPCNTGETRTAPSGHIYLFLASDGPHFPDAVPLFWFAVSVDGHRLTPISRLSLNRGAIEQMFYAGPLDVGQYQVTYYGAVFAEITDPLGQTWGPDEWSFTCTLIIEDE